MSAPAPAHPGDPGLARWLRRELARRPPRARSLIVTVWGDALAPHGGEVWLATLFRLLAPFGVNERLVRTSVFRLARDGWLAAGTVGRRSRYRLTATGAQRFAQAYRRVYTAPGRPWNGRWEMVVATADAIPPGQRRAVRDELAWNGYAAFAPGVYARPAEPASSGAPRSAGLDAHPSLLRFTARDLPGDGPGRLAHRVGEAWALGALAAEYRAFTARHAPAVEAFRGSKAPAPEQAFVVRTLLVHEYRRVRLRDPQLPPALLPAGWPGAAAYALCRAFHQAAQPLAEEHLAAMVARDGDALLPALPEFLSRFPAPTG